LKLTGFAIAVQGREGGEGAGEDAQIYEWEYERYPIHHDYGNCGLGTANWCDGWTRDERSSICGKASEKDPE
jgi:hypothetical protein